MKESEAEAGGGVQQSCVLEKERELQQGKEKRQFAQSLTYTHTRAHAHAREARRERARQTPERGNRTSPKERKKKERSGRDGSRKRRKKGKREVARTVLSLFPFVCCLFFPSYLSAACRSVEADTCEGKQKNKKSAFGLCSVFFFASCLVFVLFLCEASGGDGDGLSRTRDGGGGGRDRMGEMQ